ncbi:hypothetical protein [Nitratifractor sp.]
MLKSVRYRIKTLLDAISILSATAAATVTTAAVTTAVTAAVTATSTTCS